MNKQILKSAFRGGVVVMMAVILKEDIPKYLWIHVSMECMTLVMALGSIIEVSLRFRSPR